MSNHQNGTARHGTARHHQQGFTLVEIGVVLVIIGLLLAAVLKGQELIASARVANYIQNMNAYKASINGFQDRYRIVPGDSSRAATIVGNGAINCTDTCDDGLVNSGTYTANNHLSAAGFYSGSPGTGGYLPNPQGEPIFYLWYSNYYIDGHGQSRSVSATGVYTGYMLSPKFLGEVDRRTDDGNTKYGTMRLTTLYTAWQSCGLNTIPLHTSP